jgi:hypothetical protein
MYIHTGKYEIRYIHVHTVQLNTGVQCVRTARTELWASSLTHKVNGPRDVERTIYTKSVIARSDKSRRLSQPSRE